MEDNPNKKTNNKQTIYLIVGLLGLLVLVGIIVWLVSRGGDGSEPQNPAVEEIVGDEGQIVEVYNPCADDELEEKPLHCFTDTNYSLNFLGRFRSSPDRCWVAVNGYAYDVTPGPGGYEYPGPGGIDHLCGQDASERFTADSVPPPDREYLEGSVR